MTSFLVVSVLFSHQLIVGADGRYEVVAPASPTASSSSLVSPSSSSSLSSVVSSSKTKVYFWSTSGCIPCEKGKKALKEAELPFEVIFDPDFLSDSPDGPFPVIQWTSPGKKHRINGWYGLEPTLETWRSTQTSSPKSQASLDFLASYSGPRVGVRGSVYHHLINDHHFHPSQLAGYSQDALFRIHSAVHRK